MAALWQTMMNIKVENREKWNIKLEWELWKSLNSVRRKLSQKDVLFMTNFGLSDVRIQSKFFCTIKFSRSTNQENGNKKIIPDGKVNEKWKRRRLEDDEVLVFLFFFSVEHQRNHLEEDTTTSIAKVFLLHHSLEQRRRTWQINSILSFFILFFHAFGAYRRENGKRKYCLKCMRTQQVATWSGSGKKSWVARLEIKSL